jgi:hypothetical protein
MNFLKKMWCYLKSIFIEKYDVLCFDLEMELWIKKTCNDKYVIMYYDTTNGRRTQLGKEYDTVDDASKDAMLICLD